ncbi:DUF2931 family protein [Pseudomonas sp. Pc102]|uniref:DUF2931 family protein n=1 Tax=Pseudomonas sp. Pc102 TaxID=2678261 RepID=UPI0032AF5A5E
MGTRRDAPAAAHLLPGLQKLGDRLPQDCLHRHGPGGIAKAWVGGPCLSNIEIGRYQAKVDTRGPYEGHSNGRYYRPPTGAAQAYIEQHGIPYESW